MQSLGGTQEDMGVGFMSLHQSKPNNNNNNNKNSKNSKKKSGEMLRGGGRVGPCPGRALGPQRPAKRAPCHRAPRTLLLFIYL